MLKIWLFFVLSKFLCGSQSRGKANKCIILEILFWDDHIHQITFLTTSSFKDQI